MLRHLVSDVLHRHQSVQRLQRRSLHPADRRAGQLESNHARQRDTQARGLGDAQPLHLGRQHRLGASTRRRHSSEHLPGERLVPRQSGAHRPRQQQLHVHMQLLAQQSHAAGASQRLPAQPEWRYLLSLQRVALLVHARHALAAHLRYYFHLHGQCRVQEVAKSNQMVPV